MSSANHELNKQQLLTAIEVIREHHYQLSLCAPMSLFMTCVTLKKGFLLERFIRYAETRAHTHTDYDLLYASSI